MSSSACFTFASSSTASTAVLSLSWIASGVAAGTSSPNQAETSRPGKPSSAKVGTSGSVASRCFDITASALRRPSRICLTTFDPVSHSTSSAPLVSASCTGPPPANGRCSSLQTEIPLQRFAGEMLHRAVAGRADHELARLAERDQLVDVSDAELGVRADHDRELHDLRDRRQRLQRIERAQHGDVRIDRQRSGMAEEQRAPVGQRVDHLDGGDIAAGTRLVDLRHRRTEPCAERLQHRLGRCGRRTAGRKRDDDFVGLGVLCAGATRRRAEQRGRCTTKDEAAAGWRGRRHEGVTSYDRHQRQTLEKEHVQDMRRQLR